MRCLLLRSLCSSKIISAIREIFPRLMLLTAFLLTERMTPFYRHIPPDEVWLYRNPRRESYVSNTSLWCLVIVTPITLTILHLIVKRDKEDFFQTLLAVSLSLGINCVLTNLIKLIVGRPRPDFFWRCFPDGEMNPEMNSEMQCTGPIADVIEGRKSFPSGHSSISFSSLGTISWWLMGKLHVWSSCRGSSWRLLFSITPLVIATSVALSRTCDYHHHWQDVTMGSLMGLIVSYSCYRQYFPSLSSQYCHKPYTAFRQSISTIPENETSCLLNSYSSNICVSCQILSSSNKMIDKTFNDVDLKFENKDDELAIDSHIQKNKDQVKWI